MAKNKASQSSGGAISTRTFLWAAVVTSILAIADHAYLMIEHFNLKFGAVSGKSLCDLNGTFNCSAVSASKYAEVLGIPTALWGMIANIAILLLLLWYPLVDENRKPAARRNILILAGGIAVVSVGMAFISTFLISKFCLFCIAAYVLSFILIACVWMALPKPDPSQERIAGAASSPGDFVPLIVLAAVGLLAAFIANDQISQSYGLRDFSQLVNSSVTEWMTDSVHDLKAVDPLVEGPEASKAKMTIVEFADFRCVHCKHAVPVLAAFVAAHPDVRLEFTPWPLDGECNTSIPQSNGASCMLARAAWCARKSSMEAGWKTHAYIYDQETYMAASDVEAALPKIAAAAGIPSEEMVSCVKSEPAKDAVRKQAEVGSALSLEGTPTIYVNGRKLPAGQTMPVLQEAYRRSTL